MLRELITWEQAALPPAVAVTRESSDSPTSGGRRVRRHSRRSAGTAGATSSNAPEDSITATSTATTTSATAARGRSGPETSRSTAPRSGRIGPCLKCEVTSHHVRDCPLAGPGEADSLLQDYYKSRDSRRAA
ncbi:hypothetical protein GN958_ATG00784 [Phytophthora infestans]|uniref:Uncharacterized protein n=1 Tax=Phytophthora infestans TaxID=4787 RepID=A0A8S9VAW2_PHYIN|nr:hypothetical protein GN958_ATG00784 [Phytophthora infestans]